MSREKILPNPRLDFLTPLPNSGLLREMFSYTAGLLGISVARLKKVRTSEKLPSNLDRRIDQLFNFFGRSYSLLNTGSIIRRIYGFSNDEIALEGFIKSQGKATALVNGLVRLYGLDIDSFGLKDEVSDEDPKLGRLLAYTSPRSNITLKKGTSPRSRFEELRELWLSDISLRNMIKTKEEEPLDKIGELKASFNNELYEGKAGEGVQVTSLIKFNEEHGVQKIYRPSEGKNYKRTEKKTQEMRKIKVAGKDIFVEVNFDKKTGVSKLIKLIGDFYEKERNEINFAEYLDPEGKPLLQDRQRFSMAIKGDSKAIEKIIKRVNMFFENVVEKSINNDHGQNPTVKKRFIGEYKGVPFEMVYYDQEGFINSKNHVGKKSQKKIPVKIRDKEFEAVFDIFDGSAHDLYEIRRSLPIIFLIFPYEIYRQPNQSPEDYIKMIQEAVRSRISDVVLNLRRSVH